MVNPDGKDGKTRAEAPGTAHSPEGVVNMAREFFRLEAAGGIVLVAAALLALIVANSPLYPLYDYVFNIVLFRIGFEDPHPQGWNFFIEKPVLLWINDALMAIFFFLVGLEIKREFMEGELAGRSRALLPALAAIGGMAAPAAVFFLLNVGAPENQRGWAIPAATDIAFALGVLALLGPRVPPALKILLAAIAIIDDLGAIAIIALFYSQDISAAALAGAGAATFALFALSRRGVASTVPYILIGVILWVFTLKSGIHATLAGVVTALFIPLHSRKDPKASPLKELEHALHPTVAFAILPLFAFANAGVPFRGVGIETLTDPLTLGIALGLFAGKQAGIFGALFLAIRSGVAPMPGGCDWRHLYGVALLCGIGFTMSLFIGGLAFDTLEHQAAVRIGVLAASTVSAAAGYAVLRGGASRRLIPS